MSQEQTKQHFDYRWQQDPVTGEEVEKRARDRIIRNGWTVEEFEEWVKGKKVLDVGCGMGWWTDYVDDLNGEAEAVGIDLSEGAIEQGHELGIENIHVGDMSNLDFSDEEFDYIAVENCLHQTPKPEEYFQHIVTKLKPGGTITLYVYKEKSRIREAADTLIRDETVDMDREDVLQFAEQMSGVGEELYNLDEEITVPDIPLLGIEGGTYTVHEFVYRHLLHCYYDWDGKGQEYSVLCNFNWFNPEYTFRFSESELRSMFDEAGLEVVHFNEQMSGHSVRAEKRE
ncbi:class I SAM-dependent methyltransferase [Halorientalis pallida]|uniref:Class I SAM-dependent methyltransferase n=1 Tax=Halorientalis pallida TaxID=2479928 RepID=A0A498KYM8_9EURY|nr:class I SAM-dependent methyltransferase [Halorientalis pallida]RXK47440.1 class I SAM-dependent methyltransferase [Halorientalis pallida]